MRTNYPRHLRTFAYIGLHRYFLTLCTLQRQRLLIAQPVIDLLLAQFLRAATENRFAIIAYCFMPDHVHLLVEGQAQDSDGSRFIARAKQYSAFYCAKSFGGALWQRYGFEHVVRDDEQTLAVARYIVANPVRAGLARSPQEYPFSGSSVYPTEVLIESVRSG